MVYRMEIYVDGGCRGNGQYGAIGAAAAVFEWTHGAEAWTRTIPSNLSPTNQRAELTAVIIALRRALEISSQLGMNPWVDVRIHSDSTYVVHCMTSWRYNWFQNGWRGSAGFRVANRDLIEEASYLDDLLRELGTVQYIWIPRAQLEGACSCQHGSGQNVMEKVLSKSHVSPVYPSP